MIRSSINKLINYKNKTLLNRYNTYINRGSSYKLSFKIEGQSNNIFIDSFSSLQNLHIVIKGEGHRLLINKNVHIKAGVLWLEGNNNTIEIGEETTIENANIAVTEENGNIKIGKDCMLSNEISIRNGDSHPIFEKDSGERLNCSKDIFIGNHVWIGARAVILKGVAVGDNSVVGIGTIVTKDVPANSIVGGIPSKILKSNIIWERSF